MVKVCGNRNGFCIFYSTNRGVNTYTNVTNLGINTCFCLVEGDDVNLVGAALFIGFDVVDAGIKILAVVKIVLIVADIYVVFTGYQFSCGMVTENDKFNIRLASQVVVNVQISFAGYIVCGFVAQPFSEVVGADLSLGGEVAVLHLGSTAGAKGLCDVGFGVGTLHFCTEGGEGC